MTPLTDEMVAVGDGHQLCVRTFGTPGRIPVMFLHGGPGSGVQIGQLGIFDPQTCHIFAFDQRGAGLSRPARSREANTTQHLVADIELLRKRFGIIAWIVVGGSWGATLALAYAEAHPSRVLGLVLRATFLGRREEINWAFGQGLCTFHPPLHRDFLEMLPEEERSDPLPAYWQRILSPDPALHLPFAQAWHDTERILSQIDPPNHRLDFQGIRNAVAKGPASPYLEAHYFTHDCFLTETPLLEGAERLAGIPATIVQARYDLLCPPSSAFTLVDRWPEACIQMVENAGHSLKHPAVSSAVETAITQMIGRSV